MDKENLKRQDDIMRKLFAGTKIKAGENLKYRIMQQVETESIFAAKKSKNRSVVPFIGNMLLVFGVMYALIIIYGISVYLTGGLKELESVTFFIPVIMIASVCVFFWMISACDDKRRLKHTHDSSGVMSAGK